MRFATADLPTRFADKICEDVSGCWLWIGSVHAQTGYGMVRFNGRTSRAHRAVYLILAGRIPNGLHLDHLCRVRRCVNPAHLEPVTQAENNRRVAALRTHCPHGHPFTPENTGYNGGGRICRACALAAYYRHHERNKARQREYQRRKRAEVA